MARRDFAERFWEKADRSRGPDACWPWTAFTFQGYGRIATSKRRSAAAHRVAYTLTVGPIPVGLQIDHLCRNHGCVNPAHMEVVTQAENVRRGIGGWNSAVKTHCPRGHEYDATNTYRHDGRRHCRECRRINWRAWDARRKVAA